MSLPEQPSADETVTKQKRIHRITVERTPPRDDGLTPLKVVVEDEYLEDGERVHIGARRLSAEEADQLWTSATTKTFKDWVGLINTNAG